MRATSDHPRKREWALISTLALLAAPRCAAQAIYGPDSPIIQLDDKVRADPAIHARARRRAALTRAAPGRSRAAARRAGPRCSPT